MILYYAVGGGLGHLTRALAVLRHLDLPKSYILTAMSNAAQFAPNNQLIIVPKVLAQQPDNYYNWLLEMLQKYKIQQVYLDSFPLGIIGEWAAFEGSQDLSFYYIGRNLRMDRYSQYLKNFGLRFKESFLVESVNQTQLEFVEKHSHKVSKIVLDYKLKNPINIDLQAKSKKTWLIVHSGPKEEVEQLFLYAEEMAQLEEQNPKYMVITQTVFETKNKAIEFINYYPAAALFPAAERIFTACGFNSIQQCRPFRHKHHFIPFERRYDDQFRRAKLYKEAP